PYSVQTIGISTATPSAPINTRPRIVRIKAPGAKRTAPQIAHTCTARAYLRTQGETVSVAECDVLSMACARGSTMGRTLSGGRAAVSEARHTRQAGLLFPAAGP